MSKSSKKSSSDKNKSSKSESNKSESNKSESNKSVSEFIFYSDIPNDTIDIYGDIDIKVTKIPSDNELEFKAKLEGHNVDYSVANAIRRSILLYIPIYGFHRSNTRIENEKSYHMYNNDMIFNLIEMLPIFDIPNYWDITDPEVFMSNEVMKKLFSKFIPDKYIEEDNREKQDVADQDADKKLFNIELTLSIKNNTSDDKFVSTHDAILKIDNKISNSYTKKDPICIMVLKPGENISLSATANLGISKIHAIYEATTNAVSVEHSPTSYEIIYESLGQLDKNIIFLKGCLIIKKKLEALSQYLKKKYENTTEHLDMEMTEIELYGEDHTLGNLITTVLQKCEYTLKAGYVMPHPIIDSIVIRYIVDKKTKKDSITLILDVIEYLVRLMTKIMDSITAPKETQE